MTLLEFWFWSLWTMTAAVAGFQVFRPLVTGQGLLGLPFVAGLAWLYFYVYMAFDVAVSLREWVPIEALCLGQFVALISFLGLVIGWGASLRKPSAKRMLSDHNRYPADRLWKSGMFFIVVGCIGQYTFMAQETIDWEHTTAYWHMLYHIGYPGALLCIASILNTRPQQRRSRYLTLSIALCILLMPFLLNARRGPLFPAVIVLTFAPILFTGRPPRRLIVAGALVGSGALMLLFVAVRPYIYTVENYNKVSSARAVSGAWRAGVSDLSFSDALLGRGGILGDNEYAFHCGAVWTLYHTGMYQYGTGDLRLLTHWIPRRLWPDKPILEQGLFPSVKDEIPNQMGWQISSGGSWGGAASAFEEYGFLSPLFWAAFAYFAGRCYKAALSHQLTKEVTYLGIISSTHWLISQGFGAAFVPLCIFIIPPVVFLRFARVETVQAKPRPLPYQYRVSRPSSTGAA